VIPAGARRAERLREVVTPEGVPIRFAVALAGDRLGAFLLDLALIGAIVLALVAPLVALFAGGVLGGDLVVALAILAVFLVRTFYFAFFELSWQGQTPGKRRLRLRAVDGRGGPLSAEAIVARNLTQRSWVIICLLSVYHSS
jgi:uncharacterized RDD family membrane protein YckC